MNLEYKIHEMYHDPEVHFNHFPVSGLILLQSNNLFLFLFLLFFAGGGGGGGGGGV
jgi:hypothetical protein